LPERSIGLGFWTKVKAFERSFYVGNDYIEAARFFSKAKFLAIGGYDEALYAGEDWDLSIRLREHNAQIARAQFFIEHDEGRMSLLGSSRKKRYYAENFFGIYAKKHPAEFKQQMKFLVRFPLNKVIKQGLRHPILLSSMIFMKGLEFYNSQNVK
jgi:GT2 family glycosyltransferase